jgi:putative ABC transport system permease protein
VRSDLSFAPMAIAVLLFGVLNGINQGLHSVTARHLDRLYVMNRISMYHPLIVPLAHQVEKIPGVPGRGLRCLFRCYYQRPTVQLPIVAADVGHIFRLYPERNCRRRKCRRCRAPTAVGDQQPPEPEVRLKDR